MKRSNTVSSSRRKSRKKFLTAPSHERRIIMSAPLSKELRQKYGVRSLPIRKNDEVTVVRGINAKQGGKVIACYRLKYVIHIEKLTKEKQNHSNYQIGIHPSNVVITKLHLDKNRLSLLERKRVGKALAKGAQENKITNTPSEINNCYFGDFECESRQALAPLVLLKQSDIPVSLEDSMIMAYDGELNNNIIFTSNLPISTNLHEILVQQGEYELEENQLHKYDLTRDEFLSIFFYTLEWKDNTLNTYSRLNYALTSHDRDLQSPKWRFYLHHLFNGLRKIPKWNCTHDLYRGVKGDLTQKYPEKYVVGKTITWYAFSSATTRVDVITSFVLSDKPEPEPGTVFTLNGVFSGRSVKHFSAMPKESEILIPPGSMFKVMSVTHIHLVAWIQLKQIPTLETLLKME